MDLATDADWGGLLYVQCDLTAIQIWHYALSACGVLNVGLLLHALRAPAPQTPAPLRQYSAALRAMAVPFVLVCSLRSVFPDIYVSRTVWYDSPLNGILLHRLLATVGELCWIGQIALALAWCGAELRHYKQQLGLAENCFDRATAIVARLLPCCIGFAEMCSCTGTATTNSLFFFMEETSWVIGFSLVLPIALYQAHAVSAISHMTPGVDWKSLLIYVKILAISVVIYVVWGW